MSPPSIKVTANREERVREILDDLVAIFGPNIVRSRVMPSVKGGFHGFITLLEAED